MNTTRRNLLALPLLGMAGSSLLAQTARPGYPAGYADTVAAAQREGSLLIYSIMSAENWRPVVQGFNQLYPNIQVQTLDLPSQSEPFERYLAETATKSRSADLLIAPARENWIDFHTRGEILPYASPEAVGWPKWTTPVPGLYAQSVTPVALVWNNMLVKENERPKSFADFVALAKSKGPAWRNKIATYTPLAPFGRNVHHAYARYHGEKAWEQYKDLAEVGVRFERAGGTMVEKIISGEYAAGWFVATSTLWPRLKDPVRSKLLGWSFIGPGQPLMVSAVGIPKGARNANAAKLMVDYLLSVQGQKTLAIGGLTPARPDVSPTQDIQFTYSSIAEANGGSDRIARVDFDPAAVWDHDAFLARYRKTFSI